MMVEKRIINYMKKIVSTLFDEGFDCLTQNTHLLNKID